MTVGHVLFATGMIAFTLAGCCFVERTYLRAYGVAYRDYQSATPLLVPRLSVLWRGAQTSQDYARS